MTSDLLAPAAINLSPANASSFDEAALEILFREHFAPLCSYCQRRFKFELAGAKEAVHTGFIKLWENRETISPGSSVKAYLYRVVTNICLDMLKHERINRTHLKAAWQYGSLSFTDTEFKSPELKELAFQIDKAVSALPAEMRKIFELSRYQGLTYNQIAAKLHISVKTVETQMSRALIKLRKRLAHYLTLALLATPIIFS